MRLRSKLNLSGPEARISSCLLGHLAARIHLFSRASTCSICFFGPALVSNRRYSRPSSSPVLPVQAESTRSTTSHPGERDTCPHCRFHFLSLLRPRQHTHYAILNIFVAVGSSQLDWNGCCAQYPACRPWQGMLPREPSQGRQDDGHIPGWG